MATVAQTIPVPFAAGIESKLDPKQLPRGYLQVLENAVFQNPGAIEKRFGTRKLSSAIYNSSKGLTNIATGNACISYNNELVVCDSDTLYSYDPGLNGFVEKGGLVSASVTQSPIVRNTYLQQSQDSVVHSTGLELAAWIDSSDGGVSYTVRNYNTGQIIIAPTQVSATSTVPKTVAFGTYLALYFMDSVIGGGSALNPVINVILFSTQIPTSQVGPVSLTASTAGGFLQANANIYDVCVVPAAGAVPDQLYLAFSSNGSGGTTTVFSYLANLPTTLVNSTSINVGDLTENLTVFEDEFNQGPVVATSVGSGTKTLTVANWLPFTASAPSLVWSGNTTVALPNITTQIAGITSDSSSAGNYDIYITDYGTASTSLNAKTFRLQVRSQAIGTLHAGAHSVAIAAKPFAYAGRTYVPVVYQSPLNSTYFVIDSSANIVARFLGGLAGDIQNNLFVSNQAARVPETSQLSATQFVSAYLVKDLLSTIPVTTVAGTATTATYTQTGVTAVTIDMFDTLLSYHRAVLADTLFISGGYLYQYDGSLVTEAGFHVYPELTSSQVAKSNTGGNLGSASQDTSFWYAVTYEWTDHRGNIQRSTPSIPLSATFSSGTVTGKVTLTIPTLRLTNKVSKQGTSTPVTINVYRTIGTSPDIFYACNTSLAPTTTGGINQPILNAPGSDTITFVDEMSDASLIGNPRLYSTGGVLENEAPNPLLGLTVWQNRLLGIDSMNPTTTWYSEEVIPGTPVQFSSFLELTTDPGIGAITALGVIDQFLYLYGTNQTFFTSGTGPDETGGQNQIQPTLLNTTEVGCPNFRSVVRTQSGIMSQSTKGIYLLDRNQGSEYLGASVEGLVSGNNVLSSLVVPKYNQVRFLLDTGNAVVYDTFIKQWSSFTPYKNAVDACIFQDEWVYLDSGGDVFQEQANTYTDNGQAITMSCLTGPIRLDAISGYQRVWDFFIQGTYQSPHDIVVKILYDGNTTYSQTTTVTPADPEVWGGDPTWGDSFFWGGSPFVPYIFRVFTQNDLCESLQVQLDVVPTGTNPGGGARLSSLTFTIGVLKGGTRVGQVSQY